MSGQEVIRDFWRGGKQNIELVWAVLSDWLKGAVALINKKGTETHLLQMYTKRVLHTPRGLRLGISNQASHHPLCPWQAVSLSDRTLSLFSSLSIVYTLGPISVLCWRKDHHKHNMDSTNAKRHIQILTNIFYCVQTKHLEQMLRTPAPCVWNTELPIQISSHLRCLTALMGTVLLSAYII